MPLLYESYASLRPGDTVKICFQTRETVNPQTLRNKLKQYNWSAHGLQLLTVSTHARGGCVTVKLLPSFIAPVVWLALAAIIPSVIGAVATIYKMWIIGQVTNPLLATGPLGLPMIFWLMVASAGILIPLAIILRSR